MKKIGIIGGFGPVATAKFYLKLINECRRIGLKKQPDLLVQNVPVSQKLENDLLLHGKNIDKFSILIRKAIIDLTKAKVDLVVLPCNTLHIAFNKNFSFKKPFIHIVESGILHLKDQKIKKIGILATSVSIKSGLIEKTANKFGIKIFIPSICMQKEIDQSIRDLAIIGRSKKLPWIIKNIFTSWTNEDIKDVFVACTDFNGLIPKFPGIRLHDNLDILIENTAKFIAGKEKYEKFSIY